MAKGRNTTKPQRSKQDRNRANKMQELNTQAQDEYQYQRKRKPVKPLAPINEAQGQYMCAIDSKQLTFGLGPAGTGKTYICTRMACDMLDNKEISKIIVTRPAVEASDGGIGFLPGDIHEKFAPYFAPFRAVFDEVWGASKTEYLIKTGVIEIAPLEFIRGLTFKEAFVILDEAQNTTPGQMKLFLTRLGEDAKVVIIGDLSQKDITGQSGLQDAVDRLDTEHMRKKYVYVHEFTEDDIVRSGIVKEILMAYRN